MPTLLSHFRNEEYLLPWWIAHHAEAFERAILVDYHSTDASVELIADLAPKGWKVVSSRNPFFQAAKVDAEMMSLESTVQGPKIILNTTEFLVGDLSGTLSQQRGQFAGLPWASTLIDEDPSSLPSYSIPLLEQKTMGVTTNSRHIGCFSGITSSDPYGILRLALASPLDAMRGFRVLRYLSTWNPNKRRRLLHTYNSGLYHVGRHSTYHQNLQEFHDLGVVWLGAAPWTEDFVRRKLAVRDLIPAEDRVADFGLQHFLKERDLELLRHVASTMATVLPYSCLT